MVANMRKRVLSLTLCLCMVLTLLPGTAFAADEIASGTCGANLTWTLDSGGTLRITGTGKMSNYSAEHYHKNDIPSEYGDDEIWVDGIWYYHITSPWFSHHKDIKHLVIEDGVTSIGKYAFCACESIQDVTMPTSLVNIGNLAFWSCSSISRIKIPDGVTHIGSQAFLQCKNLIRADVADSVTTIGDGAFSDCSQLYVVNIPQNLITLASGIFSDCTALEHIAIPNGITTISQLAFAGCSNLKSVNIPDSVTAIGERAFSDCTSLPSISIPDSVTTFFINNDGWIADDISHSPFSNCTSMTEIRVDANNPAYMAVDGILYNKERTILISYPAGKSESTFTVPGSVSDISWRAFSGASNLTQVVLPEGITEVGFSTFQDCTSLKSINIPDSVTLISQNAFSNCSNLQSIIIPEGVTTLSVYAFRNCTRLERITIPKSVTDMDASTFENCKKLTIHCYKDSYAHQFAENENIPYVLLDDPDEPPPEQKVSIRSVSLIRDGITSDLLGQPQKFEYGSTETADVSIETDWGDGEPGRVFLIQSRDRYTELPATDIIPGMAFEPNSSIYVIAINRDASELLDWKETKLQIVDAPPPDTPQIFISPETLDLSIGETEAVTVTTIPAGARYTLTSSDPEVVSVSDNTLTAHKLGRVEITAALVDYPNVQAVCSVAVKEGYDDLMCAIAACQLSYEDELIRYGFGATVETFADAAIGPDRTLWNWAVWDAPLSDFYKDVLGAWKIVNVVSEPSGLFAVALDNAERNQRIIAFRGTESPKDIWADIEFAVLNKLPEQFSDAVDFYKRSIGDGRQILLTGHSLGGAIACYISLLTGERAELFNGANGLIMEDAYFAGGEEIYKHFHSAGDWNFTNHVTESKNNAFQFSLGTATFNEAVAYPNADRLPVQIHAPALTATTGAVGKNSCHDLCSMLEYDRSSGRFWLTQSTPYRQTLPEVRQFEMTRVDGLAFIENALNFVKTPLWLDALSLALKQCEIISNQDHLQIRFSFGSSGDDEIIDKNLIEQVVLLGGDGNDYLVGSSINDILVGGLGRNAMDGGPMNDLYVITGTSDQYINDCSGVDDIYIPSGVRVRSYENPTDKVDEYYVLTLTNGQRIMINKNRKQDFDNRFRVYSMDGTSCGSYRTVPQETETRMIALAAEDELAEAANGLPITTLEISGRDLILEVQGDAGNSVGTVNTTADSFPLYKPYGYFYYDRQEETLRAHLFGGSGEVRISSADPVAQTVACTSIFHNAEDDLPLKRFTAEIDLQASETILTPSCVVEEPAVPFRVMDNSGNTEDIPAKTEDLTAPPKPDTPEQPTHHTLTVTSGSGSGSYSAGTRISISATIPSGKRFVRWEASGGTIEDYLSASTYFVMPNGDVTLTAILTDESTGGTSGGSSGSNGWSTSTTYAVTVEKPEHGKVTSNRTNAASGSTIALTATPDIGYVLDTLTVTDSRGNEVKLTAQSGGKYTFTMPSRAVTVKATFTLLLDDTQKPCDGGADCPSRSFTDLRSVGTWYHEAVDYVLRNGLMGGYGNGTFGPNNNLTRAQFAQILFNKEGRPVVNYLLQYGDVAEGAWYTEAIRWATSRGIVGGYGNGMFGPNDNITREQLAVMLWRYAGSPAATDKELHFTDADKASGYALEALRWAVENGILNGYGDGRLGPQGQATRAQVAQMLKNYLESYQ